MTGDQGASERRAGQGCPRRPGATIQSLNLVNTQPHLILILIISDQVKELVTSYSSPYSASEGSHAVVVCTEWDEFKTLDWKKDGRMQMMPISMIMMTKNCYVTQQ